MIDDFNQGFGDFENENDTPASPSTFDTVKHYIKPAIILIILIVGLYFTYDYFIASVVEVTVSVTQQDMPIATSFQIIDSTGKAISADSDTPIKLKVGEYTITLDSGYVPASERHFVVEKGDPITKVIHIYPAGAENISNLNTSIPATVYKGQTITIDLFYQNTGEDISLALKGTEDFNSIGETNNMTFKGGNTKSEITYNVPIETKNKSQIKGKICIKYTSICTSELTANLESTPKIQIDIGKSVNSVKAGTSFSIPFSITNKSTTQINDINIKIVYVSTNIDAELFKGWFDPISNINLNAKVGSSSAKTNGIITGKIPITEKPIEVTFNISAENSFVNEISNIVTINILPAAITLTPDSVDFGTAQYGISKSANIDIKNEGEETLSDIQVTLENFNAENNLPSDIEQWSKITILPDNDIIDAQDIGKIRVDINVPKTAKDDSINFDVKITTNTGEFIVPIKGKIKGILFDATVATDKTNYDIHTEFSNTTGTALGKFTITNKGDIDFIISQVSFLDACKSKIKNLSAIQTVLYNAVIEKSKTKEVALELSGIFSTQTKVETPCQIIISYIDPIKSDELNTIINTLESPVFTITTYSEQPS